MANHLNIIPSRQRSAVAEVVHDGVLREYSRVPQRGYDALIEDLVRSRETHCFAPADRSVLRILNTGRVMPVNPVPRTEGMPKHDASDVLFAVLDKCWNRDPAKPQSERDRLYRDVTQKVFSACVRCGLPIPENNPIVGMAIERGGIDPSTIPMVEVEEASIGFVANEVRARQADTLPLSARRELGLIERGGCQAIHTALVEETLDR